MRFNILLNQISACCRTATQTSWRQRHSAVPSRLAQFEHGFSLVETIASISILSILLSVAAPSFASYLGKSNVRITAHELSRSLQTARSAATSYGHNVLICARQAESTECVISKGYNQSWRHGWQSFVDVNLNNKLDPSDIILERRKPADSTQVIFNQSGRLRFFPDGSARSAGFYVCAANTSEFRHIKLLHSGRTRTSAKGTNKAKNKCDS